MLSLVAAVVLMGAEPSAAGLAARFVQVQASEPGTQPTADAPEAVYAGWTHGQLDLEYRRLEGLRPSPGLAIALLAGGAAIAVIDLVVVMFAALIALTGSSGLPVQLTAGIATAAFVGAGMIIIGVILLVRTLGERREVNAQMELVKLAIERLTMPIEPQPVPEPPANAPPPAMPPLQVQWAPSLVTVTLARF